MKRRSFIGILSAAFVAPKLPEAPPEIGSYRGKLRLVADEMNDLPGFNPLNYVGEFKWINISNQPFTPGAFRAPIARHENTIPETGRIETETD